jgi:hypothetical protein
MVAFVPSGVDGGGSAMEKQVWPGSISEMGTVVRM